MQPMQWIACSVALVGLALIVMGMRMSWREWETSQAELVLSRRHELGESLAGLAKLLEALKAYPAGQRLVVFGIVVLFVAASLFGVAAL